MANNYTQSSTMMEIPKDKRDKAQLVIDKFLAAFPEDGDEFLDISAELESDGVWIYGEESFDPDQAAELAQLLLNNLEIDEPFIFSWAYTCSKLRLDEFGGGACLTRRGHTPVFVDARSHIETILHQLTCPQDTQQS